MSLDELFANTCPGHKNSNRFWNNVTSATVWFQVPIMPCLASPYQSKANILEFPPSKRKKGNLCSSNSDFKNNKMKKPYAYIKTCSSFSNFSCETSFINQLTHQVQSASGEPATHGTKKTIPLGTKVWGSTPKRTANHACSHVGMGNYYQFTALFCDIVPNFELAIFNVCFLPGWGNCHITGHTAMLDIF